jgi:lipopolysaccharide transport protein LptA
MSALSPAALVLLALLTLLAVAPVAAAQTAAPAPAITSAMPINLDAASSEFDGRSNRLVFRELRIKQGPLSVRADVAEASRLDFENSRWVFRGNVEIENQGARVESADATLLFVGYELARAELTGQPARFEQRRGDGALTEGRAGTINYDVAGGILNLSNRAWLKDGAQEISSDLLSYDLKRARGTALAGDTGPIKVKIDPPQRRPGGRVRP